MDTTRQQEMDSLENALRQLSPSLCGFAHEHDVDAYPCAAVVQNKLLCCGHETKSMLISAIQHLSHLGSLSPMEANAMTSEIKATQQALNDLDRVHVIMGTYVETPLHQLPETPYDPAAGMALGRQQQRPLVERLLHIRDSLLEKIRIHRQA